VPLVGTGTLTLPQANAYAMIRRRAAAAGIATKVGSHNFRARRHRLSQEWRQTRKGGANGQPRLDAHDAASMASTIAAEANIKPKRTAPQATGLFLQRLATHLH